VIDSWLELNAMSALPPRADMSVATSDVRLGPKADIAEPISDMRKYVRAVDLRCAAEAAK
jgi:hypothetical protein